MPFSFLSYPLDLLGTAGTNHITNETRAFVTAADRHFVPAAGPFYASSMIIRHGTTNTVLFPNTHYKLLHTHLEGTLASGKTVVAVVHIVDTSIPSISMDYRAIGGSFAETASVIAQNLQDNPPIGKTVWGQIIGQPPQYAPAEHLHNADEIYGLGDVVAALEHLRMAILQNDAMAIDAIYQYINVRLSNENYVTQDQLVNSVGGSAKIRVYTTAATLRAVTDVSTHQDYLYVLVGEGTANDKHGRLYYWDPTCELLEDASLNVIKPDNVNSAVAGRFVSILRVEGDLASEITTRQSAVSALQTALSNEITARYNADTVLTNAITALQSDLLAKASTAALAAEISARQNADTALGDSITSAVNTVTGLVNQEATNRANADTALQNNINSEATARQTGDQNLQNQIDALSGAAAGFATTTQLNTEITDRQNAISAEATARQNTDTALVNAIADQAMNLTTESVARANADAALQGQITNHVVPTPPAGGLFLQSTGSTPGSFEWDSFDSAHNRAITAAMEHDGFKLVWDPVRRQIVLYPINGGLIYVDGELVQIPENGIACPLMNHTDWVDWCAEVLVRNWQYKSMWVVLRKSVGGGYYLDLKGGDMSIQAGHQFEIYDSSLPWTGYLTPNLFLHSTTKTPILNQIGTGDGHSAGRREDLTVVGYISLMSHGGYWPGHVILGYTAYTQLVTNYGRATDGDFVHSFNTSGGVDYYYSFLHQNRFAYHWGSAPYGKTLNADVTALTNCVFKQLDMANTYRYEPDPALISLAATSGGVTYPCLFATPAGAFILLETSYEVVIYMPSNPNDERLWGVVASAFPTSSPMEIALPGDWSSISSSPTAPVPSYIIDNGTNLPDNSRTGSAITPILNAWNAGGKLTGRAERASGFNGSVNSQNVYLFAEDASHGSPTSDIKITEAIFRVKGKNPMWRNNR